MSEQAIEPFKFARSRRRQTGTIPVERLPRLSDILRSSEGEVSYLLEGDADPDGRLFLVLRVQADLELICQRCMGEMQQKVSLDTRYLLTESDVDAAQFEKNMGMREGLEVLLAQGPLNLESLVEDEILLALPFSPRHDEENCRFAAL
jgi:DUF177 domain-containing protein